MKALLHSVHLHLPPVHLAARAPAACHPAGRAAGISMGQPAVYAGLAVGDRLAGRN